MELARPGEPLALKEVVLAFLQKHPEAREEGGHAVAEVAAYWYGNWVPRYLWKSGWEAPLRGAGLNEDRFMRIIGAHRVGFYRWIDGRLLWREYLELLIQATSKTAERIRAQAQAARS